VLDPIVLVARQLGGGRVNVIGLRLPEDEEETVPLTRWQTFRRKLARYLVAGRGGLRRGIARAVSNIRC